ncbi:retrotransposon protein, putative, ty1-copia subclass [Tanacetum coccineum]
MVESSIVKGIAPVAIIDCQLPFEYTIASRSTDVMVWNAVYDAHNEVACLMLGSMTPELHGRLENSSPYEMLQKLKSMFKKQVGVERFDLIQTFHACKPEEGKSVSSYILKMKGYVEQLERLGYVLPQDPSVGLIMASLVTLLDLVKVKAMERIKVISLSLKTLNLLLKSTPAKDDACHHYKEVGHYKRNCLAYLAELIKKKKQVGTTSSSAKHNLDSTFLWSCRLAYISKKRIEKLQQDGLLKSTDEESFDQCVSCLTGKMTRKLFPHRTERATDLLGIIHTDVCGPLRHVSRQETTTRILNMVTTKKVDKTPYELWYGKVPNLSYLKEMMGYYFYFPPENKIVVARYAEFLEKNLLSQEVSGRAEELEEIQYKDTSPSENTNKIPMEVEGFEPPQEEVVPIRRSARTHQAPDRLCLNIEVEEHSLGGLNEPTNYKAAMLDPESDKWLDVMNAEMQSMKDNQVWRLVDLPPNCKTVGSKWIFKKKTDMDGIVHTYKARLVAKGYTQTYGVDYEETFSPVADIRAIRILIAIVTFYDCEMWQMDVKTAFLNGYLDENIYMVSKRLIGLSQSAYMDKILKRFRMDNSKRGYIPMQERLDLNKTQGASTPKEVKRMQNVPYASVVGEPHWTAVKIILQYLRNIKDMILVYDGNPEAELRVDCYCNVVFETNRDDIKSQDTSSLNNIAALEAAMEAVWIRKFILGLGIVPTINEPIKMFCDNSAALLIANEPGVQRSARHYHRRYHYVRECIELGEINLLKVHTDENLADPFTKALPKGKLTQHARSMGLRLASSGDMHRVQIWNDIVDRIRSWLSKWKMKMLSIGGRLTLVKSVLGSMPIFHMSLFKVPAGILRTLESIRCHFFNGHDITSKKVSWVQWNKVLASKDNGGLGVSSLFALNRGSINGTKSCWLSIVNEINVLAKKSINLMDFMHIKLGNGDSTAFWEDLWCADGRLKDRYPRAYSLETCKSITVSSKLMHPTLAHSFLVDLEDGR